MTKTEALEYLLSSEAYLPTNDLLALIEIGALKKTQAARLYMLFNTRKGNFFEHQANIAKRFGLTKSQLSRLLNMFAVVKKDGRQGDRKRNFVIDNEVTKMETKPNSLQNVNPNSLQNVNPELSKVATQSLQNVNPELSKVATQSLQNVNPELSKVATPTRPNLLTKEITEDIGQNGKPQKPITSFESKGEELFTDNGNKVEDKVSSPTVIRTADDILEYYKLELQSYGITHEFNYLDNKYAKDIITNHKHPERLVNQITKYVWENVSDKVTKKYKVKRTRIDKASLWLSNLYQWLNNSEKAFDNDPLTLEQQEQIRMEQEILAKARIAKVAKEQEDNDNQQTIKFVSTIQRIKARIKTPVNSYGDYEGIVSDIYRYVNGVELIMYPIDHKKLREIMQVKPIDKLVNEMVRVDKENKRIAVSKVW